MILLQQYCALDATIIDEIHRGCHLIVNSLEELLTISPRELKQRRRMSGPECIHLHFILACDLILLSTKLGEASFYSRLSEIFVTRSTTRSGAWGLSSGDAKKKSGTAD